MTSITHRVTRRSGRTGRAGRRQRPSDGPGTPATFARPTVAPPRAGLGALRGSRRRPRARRQPAHRLAATGRATSSSTRRRLSANTRRLRLSRSVRHSAGTGRAGAGPRLGPGATSQPTVPCGAAWSTKRRSPLSSDRTKGDSTRDDGPRFTHSAAPEDTASRCAAPAVINSRTRRPSGSGPLGRSHRPCPRRDR